jgi:membrane fusion protein, multidrug efflux system
VELIVLPNFANFSVISSRVSLQRVTSIATLTGAVILVSSLVACQKAAEPVAAIRPALVYKIGAGAGQDAEVYPGEIRARNESDQAFRVNGKIIARLVDQGAVVKRGQALARLDPQDAALTSQAAGANVAAFATEDQFARSEYQRFKDLFAKGFVSQSALDQKLNVSNAAAARLAAAKAQAGVSANQSSYTTLTASEDGVVTSVLAEAGQVVAAGQTVLRIANPANKELAIHIPEGKVAMFRTAAQASKSPPRAKAISGDTLKVVLWSQPGTSYAAKVREVAGAADAITRTYAVRIALDAPTEAVQLGMSAYGLFVGASDAVAISVPLSAIYIKGDQAYLWKILADGKLASVPVTVVQYKETSAQVAPMKLLAGVPVAQTLTFGDVIVAAGVHKLRDGEQVRPITDVTVRGDGKVGYAPNAPVVDKPVMQAATVPAIFAR